ncbi:MAG TPA: polysaccharide deacetylase family protein [Chthoniobacterales bacterium]
MQNAPDPADPTVSGLVVSIHDVSPATREMVELMIADLRAAGVAKTSLLVIPNHHHRGVSLEDPAFAGWLAELERQGHEVVVHGYYHRREAKAKEGAFTKWVTRHYTAGEGEFFDLPESEAQPLLDRALAEFRAGGFAPKGFIAPAWLLGWEAELAVRSRGFDYTTRIASLTDLRRNLVYHSRSLVYSARAFWRRQVSLLWNWFVLHRVRYWPLVRMGLHPPDWKYPLIRAHALGCIRHAMKKRPPMTYWEWLEAQRKAGA